MFGDLRRQEEHCKLGKLKGNQCLSFFCEAFCEPFSYILYYFVILGAFQDNKIGLLDFLAKVCQYVVGRKGHMRKGAVGVVFLWTCSVVFWFSA